MSAHAPLITGLHPISLTVSAWPERLQPVDTANTATIAMLARPVP